MFKRLRAHQWAWIHFKLSLGFGWTIAMFLLTPEVIKAGLTDFSLFVWTGSTMVGAIVSVTGMLISTSPRIKTETRGLLLELLGLILLAGGPIAYTAIQISYLFAPGGFGVRFALVMYSWSLIAAMLARAVHVGAILFKGAAR